MVEKGCGLVSKTVVSDIATAVVHRLLDPLDTNAMAVRQCVHAVHAVHVPSLP